MLGEIYFWHMKIKINSEREVKEEGNADRWVYVFVCVRETEIPIRSGDDIWAEAVLAESLSKKSECFSRSPFYLNNWLKIVKITCIYGYANINFKKFNCCTVYCALQSSEYRKFTAEAHYRQKSGEYKGNTVNTIPVLQILQNMTIIQMFEWEMNYTTLKEHNSGHFAPLFVQKILISKHT